MFRHDSCRRVRALLPLHAGSDLPATQARLVDEHLHQCLSCFREHREFVAMRERLGVLAEEPLPGGALDGFVEEVMARIESGEAGPRAEAPRRSAATVLTLPRVAAAAALVLAVGFGLRSQSLSPAPAAPHAPAAPVAERSSPPIGGSLVGVDDGGGLRAQSEPRLEWPLEQRLGVPVGADVRSLQLSPDEIVGTGLVPEPERRLRPRRPGG